MTNKQIACNLHDYVEIACMYRYRVKLKLNDGRTVEGFASDVITTGDKAEYLVLTDSDVDQVELTEINRMTVLTSNARFQSVSFR